MIRIPADGIGQFMHDDGRIDKVIQVSELPDGGGFEEFMAFITGTGAVRTAGHKEDGLLLNGQHVRRQLCAHGAVT